ncbi:hypothetical protein D9M68_972510 [compost metagenome]
MLGLDGNDVLAAFSVEVGGTLDGQVVGFSGTGRPDDFTRVGVHQLGDFLAGTLDGFFRFPAECMAAGGRVAEILVQPGHHLFHDAGIDGRRGRIVQIDRASGHFYSS